MTVTSARLGHVTNSNCRCRLELIFPPSDPGHRPLAIDGQQGNKVKFGLGGVRTSQSTYTKVKRDPTQEPGHAIKFHLGSNSRPAESRLAEECWKRQENGILERFKTERQTLVFGFYPGSGSIGVPESSARAGSVQDLPRSETHRTDTHQKSWLDRFIGRRYGRVRPGSSIFEHE